MNRTSLSRRLQRLEAKAVALSFVFVCADDIGHAAKAKMRPSDLGTLREAMANSPEDFTPAHRAVWNRWKTARANAIQEARAGAGFLIMLSAADCRV